jgi:NADPH:quinone reductase-like Zn-dependent oxidoreductase
MRAVVQDRYGPPEVLRVAEVERPVPKEDEVLVRVHASTVTRGDAIGVRGVEYWFTRLFTGIRRPRRTIAGSEFAGRVEEVGAAVTEFRAGDEVFGIEGGANAEYVTTRQSGVIAQKPTGLTYEEAAAVPDGSLLALTCLRPTSPLRGKSVLVYGAAGSIGTAAVQLLAHHFEAEVTAVCDTRDVELVRLAVLREVLAATRAGGWRGRGAAARAESSGRRQVASAMHTGCLGGQCHPGKIAARVPAGSPSLRRPVRPHPARGHHTIVILIDSSSFRPPRRPSHSPSRPSDSPTKDRTCQYTRSDWHSQPPDP